MKIFLKTWCYLAPALVVAVAGVLDLIDQTTMIILIVVLMVVKPNAGGACRPMRKA